MTTPPNMGKVLYHDGEEVGDLKIYHDYSINQFKVRHRCSVCYLDLGCYCYETIDDAIYACDEVDWNCAKHILISICDEYGLAEEIDVVFETNIASIKDHSDKSKEVAQILESITEEQAKRILDNLYIDEVYDLTWGGEACTV